MYISSMQSRVNPVHNLTSVQYKWRQLTHVCILPLRTINRLLGWGGGVGGAICCIGTDNNRPVSSYLQACTAGLQLEILTISCSRGEHMNFISNFVWLVICVTDCTNNNTSANCITFHPGPHTGHKNSSALGRKVYNNFWSLCTITRKKKFQFIKEVKIRPNPKWVNKWI